METVFGNTATNIAYKELPSVTLGTSQIMPMALVGWMQYGAQNAQKEQHNSKIHKSVPQHVSLFNKPESGDLKKEV